MLCLITLTRSLQASHILITIYLSEVYLRINSDFFPLLSLFFIHYHHQLLLQHTPAVEISLLFSLSKH